MTKGEILDRLREKFKDSIMQVSDKSLTRVYVDIHPDSLPGMGEFIFRSLGARFNTASAMDTRSHIEILYHFTVETANLVISLRVALDRKKPVIASMTKVLPAAEYIEREMHELLGIGFTGHPNLKRLLLPDEWPDGIYPLRQGYREWDKSAIRDRGV